MQVSWIDADKLRKLVAQIAPDEASPPAARQQRGEINAEPEMAAAHVRHTAWMDDWPAEADECALEPTGVLEDVETGGLCEEPREEAESEEGPVACNESAALPLSRIRDKLKAIRQRATEAGILTRPMDSVPKEVPAVPVAAPAAEGAVAPVLSRADAGDGSRGQAGDRDAAASVPPPSFEVPQGTREERLSAYAAWAKQVLREGGGHVLVMNDDGEVLWGGEAKAGLVLSTMMAWGSAAHANTLPSHGVPAIIHRTLSTGHVLTVVPCESAAGIMHVAVVAPEAVPDAAAELLRGALCAAIS